AHAKARAHKRTFRKCSLLSLELLEANDVGLRPYEPRREIMQTLVDVVDVESGDLQWSGPIILARSGNETNAKPRDKQPNALLLIVLPSRPCLAAALTSSFDSIGIA